MGQALEAFMKSRVDTDDRNISMTVQLSHVENEKVKFWAKKFGMSKRKFLADLIMAAIQDLEEMYAWTPSDRTEYENIIDEAEMERAFTSPEPVYDED